MSTSLALEGDRAGVRRMDAREDLHERRLAGAVVADDGDDLARRDVEVDVRERRDRSEGLRDAAQGEDAGIGAGAGWGCGGGW